MMIATRAKTAKAALIALLLLCTLMIFQPAALAEDSGEDAQPTPFPVATPEPTPEPTPRPGITYMPAAIDMPDATPEVISCVMAEESTTAHNQRLTYKYLDIPWDNGMPIPRLYQYDYRTVVCSVDGESKTVSTSGCGAASASMVIAYVRENYNQTPYSLFYWAAEHGHYYGSGFSYSAVQSMLTKYGVSSQLASVSAENIVYHLKNNHPIIIKMGPGRFTREGHYIVLRGLNGNGHVLVNDPNNDWITTQSYSAEMIASESKDRVMLAVYAPGKSKEPLLEEEIPEITLEQVSYTATVNADSVNLRTYPVGGLPVRIAYQDEELQVTGLTNAQSDGYIWCAVTVDKETLYIRGDFLTVQGQTLHTVTRAPENTEPAATATPEPTSAPMDGDMLVAVDATMAPATDVPKGNARVTAKKANLRMMPVDGKIAVTLKKGDLLNVLATTVRQTDGYAWKQVLYQNQKMYIRSDMIVELE